MSDEPQQGGDSADDSNPQYPKLDDDKRRDYWEGIRTAGTRVADMSGLFQNPQDLSYRDMSLWQSDMVDRINQVALEGARVLFEVVEGRKYLHGADKPIFVGLKMDSVRLQLETALANGEKVALIYSEVGTNFWPETHSLKWLLENIPADKVQNIKLMWVLCMDGKPDVGVWSKYEYPANAVGGLRHQWTFERGAEPVYA